MKRALLVTAAIVLVTAPAQPDEATLYNLEALVYGLEGSIDDLGKQVLEVEAALMDLQNRVQALEGR